MSRLWFENVLPPRNGGQHVLLASTIYDRPDVCFLHSAVLSVFPLYEIGVGVSTLFLEGNCHVDDARNSVVSAFLESECTDLVFLDADVTWSAADLVKIILADADIAGGVYPHRRVWKQENATNMPVRMEDRERDLNADLMDVDGLPTGFMKIKRHVVEGMVSGAESAITSTGDTLPILFERCLFEGRRMSGDIAFCMEAKRRGYSVCALPELNLGHKASTIVRDSLGAMMRRKTGKTLEYVARAIGRGEITPSLMQEARRSVSNPYSMFEGGLVTCAAMARKAVGPILEAGSGLSSVVMAAANPDQFVWCLESDDRYKGDTIDLALSAGVSNIAIVTCKIENGWYRISDDIPAYFDLGIADGPRRIDGDRRKFFSVHGGKCNNIVVDDIDDKKYADFVSSWAGSVGKQYHKLDERIALIMEQAA